MLYHSSLLRLLPEPKRPCVCMQVHGKQTHGVTQLNPRTHPAVRGQAWKTTAPMPASCKPGRHRHVTQAALADTQHSQHAEVDLHQLYTSLIYTPPRFVGSVEAVTIPGRGIGLRATKDLSTGELILCVPALRVVFGPAGTVPENEALVEAIQRSDLSEEQLRWLQLLRVDRSPWASKDAPKGSSQGVAGHDAHSANDQSHDACPQHLRPVGTIESQLYELNALLQGRWLSDLAPTEAPPTLRLSQEIPTATLTPSCAAPTGTVCLGNGPTHPTPVPIDGVSTASPALPSQVQPAPVQPAPVQPAPVQTQVSATLPASVPAVSNTSSPATSPSRTQHHPGTPQPVSVGVSGLPHSWVQEAVACNSVGDVSEDVAASELQEREPLQSFCGLWPEFALVNHSCAPNTVHIVVGGHLLLRASRPIQEGQEVTTCYLGAERFKPVSLRRAELRQQYGFHCRCGRCVAEHRLFPTTRYAPQLEQGHPGPVAMEDDLAGATMNPVAWGMQWALDRVFGPGRFIVGASKTPGLLASVHSTVVDELEYDAQSALTHQKRAGEQRQVLWARLQALEAAVEEGIKGAVQGGDGRLQGMLKASVYGLYKLATELSDLVPELQEGGVHAKQLLQQVRVCESVARGSDVHLLLVSMYARRAKQVHGVESLEARQAQLMCANAHSARYGRVAPPLMQQLVQVRQQRAMGASLAQRLGVLAWDMRLEGGKR